MSQVLQNMSDMCSTISESPDGHIDISRLLILKIQEIITIGRSNPITNVRIHYESLLSELERYDDNYGNVRTPDSKKCVKRIKYRVKAIEQERTRQMQVTEQNAARQMARTHPTLAPGLNIVQRFEKIKAAQSFKIDECPCCYEEITNKNMIVLECDHLLCKLCVKKIKNINNMCPICRTMF
jgi:hypothetical protein